jgi:hypothetical protein
LKILENVNDLKKVKQILNKIYIIGFLFLSLNVFSQQKDSKTPTHKDFKKQVNYVRQKQYEGPQPVYYTSPATMEEVDKEEDDDFFDSDSKGGIQFTPEQLDKQRQKKQESLQNQKNNAGGQGGNAKSDPKMSRPEPLEINPPDINPPDFNPPNIQPFNFSGSWIKPVLFILGFILLMLIIYYLLKNKRKGDQRVSTSFSPEIWNPETITKTELELKLEEAIANEDYRTCVRIYYTFILKELISLGKIRWKKEFTNYDFIQQMRKDKSFFEFEKTVRIYDIVWYGEYPVQKQEYAQVEPFLASYYSSIQKNNE